MIVMPSYFQKDGERHRGTSSRTSRSRSRTSSRTSGKDSLNSGRKSREEAGQQRSIRTSRSRSRTKRGKHSQNSERRFPEDEERHRSTGSRDTHSRSRSRTKRKINKYSKNSGTNTFSDTNKQLRKGTNSTYDQDDTVLVGEAAICSDCQKTRSFGMKDDIMSTMAVGEFCRCSDRTHSRIRSSPKYSNYRANEYYCKMDPYGYKARYLPLEHQVASSPREKRTTTPNRTSPSLPPAVYGYKPQYLFLGHQDAAPSKEKHTTNTDDHLISPPPPATGNCCCTPSNCIPYACFDSFVEDLIYCKEAVVEFFEPQLNRENRAKRNISTADIEITKCQFKIMSIKQDIAKRKSKLKELETILLEAGSRKYEAKNELSWAETGDAGGL